MDALALRRYLRTLLLVLGAGLALVAGFTIRVDPYGVWRNLGLSESRRPTVIWSRIAAVERLRADCDVALIGSSRVVFGYSQRMPRIGRMRACNGALGGTSIRELAAVVDHVVEHTDVRVMLLFLDLHMFNDVRGYNHDFGLSRLAPGRTPLAYYGYAATSLDSLEHAFGQLGWRWPLSEPLPLRASSVETRGMIRTTLMHANMYRRFEGPDASVQELRRLLDTADQAGLRTMIILPANHAMQLEAEHVSGLWEVNRRWRRVVVEEATARQIPVWDFATYHPPARSPLPLTPADPPNPRWSDMSHQSQLLGSETLERIQDALAGRDRGWDPRFGVRLTPQNLDAHLADLDAGRAEWHAEQPEQVAWFHTVVERLLEHDPGAAADWEVNRRRALGEDVTWEATLGRDLGDEDHGGD